MQQYLTIHDVTKRLQVNASTIWRWRRKGEFPWGMVMGQIVRWTEAEINEWVDSKRNSQPVPPPGNLPPAPPSPGV